MKLTGKHISLASLQAVNFKPPTDNASHHRGKLPRGGTPVPRPKGKRG